MGRPLTPIDAEQVYKLARLGCTQEEIGDFFGVSQTTISQRFSNEFRQARADWKQSLRRAQAIRAIRDRSDSMLIHLGKTYLDQTEKSQIELSQAGGPAKVVIIPDNGRNDPGNPPPAGEGP